jgi:parvulin-like peptidyl-prolyl isomerase
MLPPEIDDAAFKLEAGQTSEMIKDSFGSFHIIQVLEKDPARALTKDQSHALGMAAFGRWIAEQRLGAKIERFIEFKDEGVTTQK